LSLARRYVLFGRPTVDTRQHLAGPDGIAGLHVDGDNRS